MLFRDDTEITVKQALARAKLNELTAFREKIWKIIDFYNGHQLKPVYGITRYDQTDPTAIEGRYDQTDPTAIKGGSFYLRRLPGESRQNYLERLHDFQYVNIVQYIANKICKSYIPKPIREIYLAGPDGKKSDQTDAIIEAVNAHWEDDDFNDQCVIADTYGFLGIGCFERILWDESERKTESDFYSYDQVTFIQDKLHPSRITHITTETATAETLGMNYSDTLYTAWGPDSYIMTVEDKVISEGPNPYGTLPFIHWYTWRAFGEVWGRGYGEELMMANESVNDHMSQIRRMSRIQGHKQIVGVDVVFPPDPVLSQMAPLALQSNLSTDKTGQIMTLDLNAQISQQAEAIKMTLDALFARFGMRNASLLRMDTGSPESGVAKYLEGFEVEEWRQRLRQKRLCTERERVEMIARVTAAHSGIAWTPDFMDKYIVNIFWQDDTMPINPDQRAVYYQNMLQADLMAPWEVLLREEPDLQDEETAKEKYISMQVAKAEVQAEIQKRIAETRQQAAQTRQTAMPTTNPIIEEITGAGTETI